MPLSRASLSVAPRTGSQLFRYLLQFARRSHSADFFPAGAYAALRSPALDDFGAAGLVRGGISADHFSLSVDYARPGQETASAGWALVPGWVPGAGGEETLTTGDTRCTGRTC